MPHEGPDEGLDAPLKLTEGQQVSVTIPSGSINGTITVLGKGQFEIRFEPDSRLTDPSQPENWPIGLRNGRWEILGKDWPYNREVILNWGKPFRNPPMLILGDIPPDEADGTETKVTLIWHPDLPIQETWPCEVVRSKKDFLTLTTSFQILPKIDGETFWEDYKDDKLQVTLRRLKDSTWAPWPRQAYKNIKVQLLKGWAPLYMGPEV